MIYKISTCNFWTTIIIKQIDRIHKKEYFVEKINIFVTFKINTTHLVIYHFDFNHVNRRLVKMDES